MLLTLAMTSAGGCRTTAALSFCAVPLDAAPMRGAEDAIVTIVEFSDFECLYCGRASGTLDSVLEAYPDEVRLLYRHMPLAQHANARPAAVAAICAQEQRLFWEMHDELFANQDALAEQDLVGHAEAIGLDVEAWDACRSSGIGAQRLDEDAAEATRARVGATPTFFVNGEPVVGAQPLDVFTDAVDRALEDAAASDVPPEDYYDHLVGLGCE